MCENYNFSLKQCIACILISIFVLTEHSTRFEKGYPVSHGNNVIGT